jgi:energy-converting hydrogenase A subunit M
MPAARRHIRQLVGRKADGWISERAWMTDVVGKLALGNRIIDEAATEAGRDPRDVRRIFDCHGSVGQARRGFLQDLPAQRVEMLLQLVIEHGVRTFILAGDDPRAIQRFGGEVTPALCEAVARERQAAGIRTKQETKTKVARKGGKSYLLYETIECVFINIALPE